MATRRAQTPPGAISGIGSDWAAHKLGVLACYLTGYASVLRQKSLQKAYIDALSNTEYRRLRRTDEADSGRAGSQGMLEGWARVALKIQPKFDRYLFIDGHAKHNLRLDDLKAEFPDRSADIRISKRNADEAIRSLCEGDWRNRRAVMFLDLFGTQVGWSSLETIGNSRAIDLWLFVPLGLGVPQLEIGADTVGRRISERLKQAFAGVAGPRILFGAAHNPLYLMCFAAGNPRSASVTLRQAQEFLDAIT